MNTRAKDGAAGRVPPPLVYIATVVTGVGLQIIWPLPVGLTNAPLIALALLLALLGVLLVLGAMRLFRETVLVCDARSLSARR